MKPSLFAWMPLVALLILSSCSKDPSNPSPTPPDEVTAMTDLVVPSSFDWTTSTNVLCVLSASEETTVSVALSATAEPFAVLPAGGDAESVTLSLPAGTSTLYLSYPTESGMSTPQAVAIAGSTLNFTVPSTKAGGVTKASATDPYVTYPANGWGTLFFEDLWPSYGDFDFNDLVVAYQIKLFPQNKNMGREMEVSIRVRAVGGSLANTLYLCLRGVKGGEIDYITKLSESNAKTPTALVALNSANNVKDPALLRFDNIRASSKQPSGVSYMNTSRGGEMSDDQMLYANFYVHFRNSIKKEDITFDLFDFFLGRTDTEKEIHMGGYSPILYGESLYNTQAASSQDMKNSPGYYYSKARLVWGFSVPAVIPHAYEGIDFVKAYPNFINWVQSGGAGYTTWYENTAGNRVNANLVNP